MPKLVTSSVARKNLRWDAKRKMFVGWQIDVYVNQGTGRNPKRHRITFPSENEAKSAENRLRVKSENIRLGIELPSGTSNVTVRELFERRLSEITRRNDLNRAARVFSLFLDLNPEVRFVEDAKPAHFDAYVLAREGASRKVAASTINREMTHLITAFRRAPKLFRELAEYQPPRMDRPKFRKNPREGVISEKDLELIIASILNDRIPNERQARTLARPVIAAIFEIGWYLGLRLGEIRRLEKRDFSEDKRSLRVVRWKTGNVSQIDFLPDRVVEILVERGRAATGDLLFDLECSEATFEHVVRDAIVAAGLIYGRHVPGGVTFHSNRHSFTTRMIQVADLATARAFTGHSNSAMVAYYSHASADSRKAAMEKLYGAPGDEERLRRIFDAVRDGAMGFEEFALQIRQN